MAQLPPMQDRTLGDFRIEYAVGEGGFGTVYRAEQRSLGRPAVVKVMRSSVAARRDAVERFALEARLASRFDHPYAAHIYAFGIESDGVMWIAMELVKGTSLDELIERSGPLPLERFVPLMERLCEVVQAAHDQGIVHRDIKPSNVMVVARGGRLMPKLLDFGIAKLVAGAEPPRGLDPRAPAIPWPSATEDTSPGQTLQRTLATSSDAIAPATSATPGSLTREGQVLGSPVYMAPEQWIDSTTVGPLADQYALALLAYEAVTGQRAYNASSVHTLADLHRSAPLPALPPALPAALHAVLARAAHKVADQRFANLTELAQAVRAASGVAGGGELDEPIAGLPAQLQAEWLGDAPRPIAEAIAALAGARSWARADERITAIASLVAHWLGVLALACQSKLGRLDAAQTIERELIQAARRRALTAHDWLELAVRLARPHGDAWPIPAMARRVARDDGVAALRALLDGSRAASTDDRMAHAAHQRRLAQLEAALDQLAWLLDLAIAREASGALELWMGQRSDEPIRQSGNSDGSGAVVLLDAYGARIARLSPLIDIAPPIAGEPDEMFMFAGPGLADDTARFVACPRGFERDVDGVWRWLAASVLETAAPSLARRDDDHAPYPGLAAFTAADRESFVGRERDVEELINRLRGQGVVTVVGPSGIGKSSFLAAGVVPALGPSWHAEIVRPGAEPLAAIAAIIGRLAAPPYREGPHRDAEDPAAIAQGLAVLAERRGTHLVVIVDQAEELFTMCSDEAARHDFARAVALAVASPRVRVVISLRDDFLYRAAELAPWRGLIGKNTQVLRVPQRDDLERMIVVPARRKGYELDDPTLAATIAAAVVDRPGALPLMAFAAATLWERRDRHFCRLLRATYDQIGGVAGALVKHADGIVDRMTAPDRRLVRLAFRRLLTTDGTRALIGRGELTSALGGTAAATQVIERLLAARLIVSRDDDGGDRIEVIHETLVTTWPRLAGWRRDDDAAARLQERIAVAAKHWHERGRTDDLLWRGPALAELVRGRDAEPVGTELEHAFARASVAAAIRRRRRRIGAVAAAFAVLVVGSAGLVVANREIAAQRGAAIERLAASFEDRGRLAIADGDNARAMLYLAEAARLGAHGTGFDVLTSHAADALDAGLEVIGHGKPAILQLSAAPSRLLTVGEDRALVAWDRTGHATRLAGDVLAITDGGELAIALTHTRVIALDRNGEVRWQVPSAPSDDAYIGCLAASPPAGLVVSACDGARLWDLITGQPRGTLDHPTAIERVVFDTSGTRIATADAQGGIQIWDARTVAQVATCESHRGRVRALVFSPDGRTVASGGNDRDVLVCDTATGATVHRLSGHSHDVRALDIAPDGKTIVSAGRDGTARLWNAHTGVLETTLLGHRGAIIAARFSPDGSRIVTAGTDDLTARLWNREGMPLGALEGHGSRLSEALWEPDGRHVLTAGYDGAIRRWDAERAIKVSPRHEHTASIADLAVSPDDRWTLTASDDASAVLWDRRSGEPVARLRGGGKVQTVAFAPDSASAVTIDDTGAAQLWSVPGGALIRKLAATGATAAAYAPEAGVVITAGDGRIVFWSAAGTELAHVALGYQADRLVIDPGRRWLFVRGESSAILVIDLRSRTAATQLAIADHHALGIIAGASHVAITDGTSIRLWQLASWAAAGVLTGHKASVADLWYLGDGRLISIADDGAMVWGRDGRVLASLSDGARVGSVAVPPDDALIATTATDGNVRIWDATTYRRLLVLPSHRLPAYAVQVSHDGASAISAGLDGRLVSWQVARRTRSPAELAELVRCRVPFRLEGDAALPREIDFDDSLCRSMPLAR